MPAYCLKYRMKKDGLAVDYTRQLLLAGDANYLK